MSSNTEFELVPDLQLIKISQQGPLSREKIKTARADTRDFYASFNICKALVDYRLADLSPLKLIELDDLAEEMRTDLPDCRYMAIVHCVDTPEFGRLEHIKRICILRGIAVELFTTIEQAQQWLIGRDSDLNRTKTATEPV